MLLSRLLGYVTGPDPEQAIQSDTLRELLAREIGHWQRYFRDFDSETGLAAGHLDYIPVCYAFPVFTVEGRYVEGG